MDSGLIVLLLIILALVGVMALVTHASRPRLNKSHFQKKWQSIEASALSSLSIIQADSLVDEALRVAGVKGNTMGERLNNSTGILRDINGAWSAHKLRNRVAHESSIKVADKDVARALSQFKKALKDLGAL